MRERKRWIALGVTLTLGVASLAGCGTKNTTKDHSAVEESSQNPDTEPTTEQATENTSETGTNDAVFAEMAQYGYTFASGAGAWSTDLNVHEDGSFDGGYSDSDMGDIGADYPNGIVYVSNFSGQFAAPEKINDYTYKTSIQTIIYQDTVGQEKIEDGVKYVYTTANGLDNAKDIYIYTKGAPISELPEGYLSWVNTGLDEGATELPWYGIYNEADESGFFGWEKNSDSEQASDAETTIDAELRELENKAQVINDQLEDGSLSQGDMNQLSAELYALWDDELNSIWKRIKNKLDADAMEALTKEERAWVQEKEKQVKDAGSEWEAGSGQPLAENTEAANLTRKRVYVLAEYLK